jgi:hypothetical protein
MGTSLGTQSMKTSGCFLGLRLPLHHSSFVAAFPVAVLVLEPLHSIQEVHLSHLLPSRRKSRSLTRRVPVFVGAADAFVLRLLDSILCMILPGCSLKQGKD